VRPPNERSRPLYKGGSQTGFSGLGQLNPPARHEASGARVVTP